jgi:hypothetical protein
MHSVYKAVWEWPLEATVIEVREQAWTAGLLGEALLVVLLGVLDPVDDIVIPVRSSLWSEIWDEDPTDA